MLLNAMRLGFTLLEIITAITIVGILGAIVVPSAQGSKDASRVKQTQKDLLAIQDANDAYDLGGAKAQLGRISFVSIQPQPGDTTSCNGFQPAGGTAVTTYTSGQAGQWDGPYLSRANSREGGFVTGIGVMEDRLVRTTRNGTTGDLVITIPDVRLEDARDLNTLMDGDAGNADLSNTLKSIRYSAPDENLRVQMTFQFPMKAKDC